MTDQQSSDQAELRGAISNIIWKTNPGQEDCTVDNATSLLLYIVTAHTKAIVEQVIGEDEDFPSDMEGEDREFVRHTRISLNIRAELRTSQRKTAQALLGG
jgi:hypothetical protein